MTLEELRNRAFAENADAIPAFYKTLCITQATDIYIPPVIAADAFVEWCNKQNIPAFLVTSTCVSMAPTYSELYFYESGR